jgi:hypothetical protein
MSPVDSNMSNPLNCLIEIERLGVYSKDKTSKVNKRYRAYENRISKKLAVVKLEYQDPNKKPIDIVINKNLKIVIEE